MRSTPLRMERPDRGALFVVSGPSGVGKSTLLKSALERVPGLSFSVSATTRDPRPGEVDGVDYHFVDADRFVAMVAQGDFLEHATVYDRRYGTPRGPVEAELAAGRSLLLDIDVQGARQVREAMPEAVHLMVLPPRLEVLENRLRARGTETEAHIALRMTEAAEQIAGAPEYDYVVVNDDLEAALATFEGVLLAELSRTSRRHTAIARLLPR